MLPTIEEMIVRENLPLKEVLKVIDAAAQGICFVVNDKQQIQGILTDGDIRRAFLNDATLDSLASEVMNTQFVSLPVDTSKEEIIKRLSSRIQHIPLVDPDNKVLDYACAHRFNRIPVSEPLLEGNELEYVMNCVRTNWISSIGKYVREFEQKLADYCNMPYALATSNGTVALHLAMEAMGIGKGDEVIVPDLTFAASINSIIYTGATPVIVDIEADSWNISPEAVEAAIGPNTKAIMPVHLYGLPANMNAINKLAAEHNLLVIEDAAEAIGSRYHGSMAGSMSDAATFSFYGNKTITTGEGGMVLFKDEDLYEKAKVLRDHGMSKEKRYWHEYVGFNYRLTNLQAAVGVAQMERVDQIVQRKLDIANKYILQLKDIAEFTLQKQEEGILNTYWLFTILLSENSGLSRDDLIRKLQMNGIETRPVFYPLHQMPPYQQYAQGKSFPNAEQVSSRGICLPSYLSLRDEEIDHVCRVLKKQVETTVYQ